MESAQLPLLLDPTMETVLITPFEAARVVTGQPMVVSTENGERVLVRLMTADELLEQHSRGMAAQGLPPEMTAEEAEKLTRPLRL